MLTAAASYPFQEAEVHLTGQDINTAHVALVLPQEYQKMFVLNIFWYIYIKAHIEHGVRFDLSVSRTQRSGKPTDAASDCVRCLNRTPKPKNGERARCVDDDVITQ